MKLRIATWNINSIRARLAIVERLVREASPDILCLQEIKVHDDLFPLEALASLGYEHIVFAGEKSYNGVAIFSRLPLTGVRCEDHLCNLSKRHIEAMLPDGTVIHNFYVPAGGDTPDPAINPKFADKLAFYDSMTRWSKTLAQDAAVILVGDLNVAPQQHDVWSHKQMLKIVSHTPVEIERMEKLMKAGRWIDVARHFTPSDQKLYSWWSYRNRDWRASDRGRRLDHIWVTPPLKDRLIACETWKDVRDWELPSDHVPVIAEIDLS